MFQEKIDFKRVGDCLSDLQSVVNKDSALLLPARGKGINGSARGHEALAPDHCSGTARYSKRAGQILMSFPVTVSPLSNEEQRRGSRIVCKLPGAVEVKLHKERHV